MRFCFLLFVLFSSNLFAQEKPNLIIFFADDLRKDALGCYGNSVIKTPTIDSLARNGTLFQQAYIQGSHHGALCAPSRAMLLTGKSYHRIKDKMKGHINLAMHLQKLGYKTYTSGKWHNEKEVLAESFDVAKDVMLGGMSDHFKVYCRDLKEDGSFTESTYKGFSTDIFSRNIQSFLEEHPKEESFFMYLPFTAPHDPRTPLPEYYQLYKNADMPLPGNFMPAHPFAFGHSMEVRDEYLAPFPRTESVMKEQWREYAGLISHLDDAIGSILETLKKKGLDKNTFVVFMADNGLAMGSHGLVGKQSVYEDCLNVPLVISGPKLPKNIQTEAKVLSIDLVPTLLELMELPKMEGVDGVSFESVFDLPTKIHRDRIFTAYMDHHRAIRVGNFKLIRYPYIDKTVLYDLAQDPLELKDISKEPKHQAMVKSMMQILQKEQERFGDKAPLYVEKTVSSEWDYTQIIRIPDPWQPTDVIEKYFIQKE